MHKSSTVYNEKSPKQLTTILVDFDEMWWTFSLQKRIMHYELWIIDLYFGQKHSLKLKRLKDGFVS